MSIVCRVRNKQSNLMEAAPAAAAAVIDLSNAEVAEAAVEAGAAVEETAVAAVEAPQRQVMGDGSMPGLEPSLAQQRRAQQGGFDVSEEYQAAEAADYAAQAAAAESDEADEAAPTASAPSAAVVQAEEPQVLTSADRAARLRRLDHRHDDAPGA